MVDILFDSGYYQNMVRKYEINSVKNVYGSNYNEALCGTGFVVFRESRTVTNLMRSAAKFETLAEAKAYVAQERLRDLMSKVVDIPLNE